MTMFYPFLFLGLATFFTYADVFPVGAYMLAWVGGVRLCNAVASYSPFPRLIHWIHAMTFELFVFLALVLLRFVSVKQIVKGNGKPILLIHGYMNHGSIWLFFKKRLEQLGFGPVYIIDLGHPFRSIRSYAAKVGEKAEQIAKETGRKDLVLIGHSMGGLVASYCATVYRNNTVTDVITIGTPLRGTALAYIGFGPNAKEMRPNSELLKEVDRAMRQNREVRFFHLATRSDQLVIPGSSAVIEENPHFIFEDLGHASLLYSKRSVAQVAHWLRNFGGISGDCDLNP